MTEFLTKEYFNNPYSFFSNAQKETPILWSDQIGAWLVFPFDLVSDGLANTKFNSGERIQKSSDHFDETQKAQITRIVGALNNWIVFQDPPKHTRLRKLVNKAFTPRTVELLRPKIEEIVKNLLDNSIPKNEFDLVAEFSYKIPSMVICELLGIPIEMQDKLRYWSDATAGFSASARVPFEVALKANQATIEAEEYLFKLFDQLQANPGENLLSKLLTLNSDEDHLNYQELAALTIQLFFAGFETTEGLIGNLVRALDANQSEKAKLIANPELIPGAVEEGLRYDSSILKQSRVASEDIQLGDTLIKQGEYVHFMIGAANRDFRKFRDPDSFIVDRADIDHVSFGHGIHFCIGAPLGRLESQIAIRQLLERIPNFKVIQPEVKFPELFAVRKPLQLAISCN